MASFNVLRVDSPTLLIMLDMACIKSMPISFLSNEYTVPELALHMNPAETTYKD